MSQEDVESVKRFLDAYNRRDVEGMLAELDPEVEWHPALPEALMEGGQPYIGGTGASARCSRTCTAFRRAS